MAVTKPRVRPSSAYSTPSDPASLDLARPSFLVPAATREYAKQYANMYWLRLAALRPKVLKRAKAQWGSLKVQDSSQPPQHVKRVLEVESGKLCYIVGTVYMDMSLKPNVLEDLAREHYIAAPPPRRKFFSDQDEIMLEDESGRVRLIGDRVSRGTGHFVTGTIMAALGAETPSGDFEVLEICYAGLPPQPERPLSPASDGEWVGLVSGLEMGAGMELRATMLAEWLTGDLGMNEDAENAARVTRLIVAGNSVAAPMLEVQDPTKQADYGMAEHEQKRYGYDSSTYSSKPTDDLDTFLSDILPNLPVDFMPGDFDATGPTMPQQPIHRAMLAGASAFGSFNVHTNPFWCDVDGARFAGFVSGNVRDCSDERRHSFLGHSGQPLDDIFKYLDTEDRLAIAVQMLEWAHMAPTCPDTLCAFPDHDCRRIQRLTRWGIAGCYPFADRDPFIISECPRVFFVGNQPSFGTELVKGAGENSAQCRVILLPRFSQTGEIVLVHTRTLECRVVSFGTEA